MQPDYEDDDGLIDAAKAGQPQAWTAIYQQHYRPVYRYCYARVGDQTLAEDLADEVFLEALRSIKSYSQRGHPFLAWLYRIARNVVVNHYRKEHGRARGTLRSLPSRVAQYLGSGGQDDSPSSEEPRIDDHSAERLDLKQALRSLPDDEREVVTLHYFSGFTLREVAGVLGIKERRVYVLQARALVRLKGQLSFDGSIAKNAQDYQRKAEIRAPAADMHDRRGAASRTEVTASDER